MPKVKGTNAQLEPILMQFLGITVKNQQTGDAEQLMVPDGKGGEKPFGVIYEDVKQGVVMRYSEFLPLLQGKLGSFTNSLQALIKKTPHIIVNDMAIVKRVPDNDEDKEFVTDEQWPAIEKEMLDLNNMEWEIDVLLINGKMWGEMETKARYDYSLISRFIEG